MVPAAAASGWRQIFRVTLIVGSLARSSTAMLRWGSKPGSRGLSRDLRRGSLVTPLLHLDGRVDEVFLVEDRTQRVLALGGAELPRRDVGVVLVVAQRLPILGLGLGPEVPPAGLAAVEGVDAHELTELEEVGDPTGLLQGLVEGLGGADDLHVAPELLAQRADQVDALAQALGRALHAAVLPHDVAELAVEGVDRPVAVDREQLVDAGVDRRERLDHGRVVLVDL